MRRNNRKNSIKKERIIMLASSAFVLTALTMTGIYMKNSSMEEKNDGYTLDFTALEDNAEDKLQEIAKAGQENGSSLQNQAGDIVQGKAGIQNQVGVTTQDNTEVQNQTGNVALSNGGTQESGITENDLDYMPLAAGSDQIEIPGVTDKSDTPEEEEAEKTDKEASAQKVVVENTVSFSESEGLLLPVEGEILMSYSMDKSIYFATLDQYKYNPAVIFSAAQGASVTAAADGKIVSIFENEEIGKAVTLDLGNGYLITYGQLEEVKLKGGAYVKAGDKLGVVAAPTKYYSTEGSNLYFKLEKDGSPVDPEGMFR